MPAQTVNICSNFYLNSVTKYRDFTSREIDVNGQTNGRPESTMTPPLRLLLGKPRLTTYYPASYRTDGHDMERGLSVHECPQDFFPEVSNERV